MKLSQKQKNFADYYIELGNAEQAAIKAGYSERYARGNAYKLVANGGVSAYIEDKMRKIADKRILSQQEALELLTGIARGEMTEEQYIGTQMGVERIVKSPDIKDRQRAIESLLKRYPVSKNDELKNRMLEMQISKLEKDLQSDTSTEDRISHFFNKLDGAINDES